MVRDRLYALLALLIMALLMACEKPSPQTVRVAVFNIKELSTQKLLRVDANGVGTDSQLVAAARIIQKIRPDILLVQEIDHDYSTPPNSVRDLKRNAIRFLRAYLRQGGNRIDYNYIFTSSCNTGMLSGRDLNRDGHVATEADRGTRAYGGDCYGYGTYPGQYSMALFANVPVDYRQARTFQKFLWQDLPGNHLPRDFYGEENATVLRLSSKSHWDVPVTVAGRRLHLLISHPTPPVFDGEEDRNGRRNFDEIKFWVHYLANDSALYDDRGRRGGLQPGANFIILGDLNAAPEAESRYDGMTAIAQLLQHPGIRDTGPVAVSQGAAEDRQPGPPHFYERCTTAFDNDTRMRVDYVLPATGLRVLRGGVYWPVSTEDPEGHQLAERASDHHLVWIDLMIEN